MAFFIWSNLLEADILKIKLIHHDHSQRFSNPKIRRNVCVFLLCWLYSFCSPNVHAEPGSNAKHDASVPFLSFVSGKGSKQGKRASMHMAWHLVLQCWTKKNDGGLRCREQGCASSGEMVVAGRQASASSQPEALELHHSLIVPSVRIGNAFSVSLFVVHHTNYVLPLLCLSVIIVYFKSVEPGIFCVGGFLTTNWGSLFLWFGKLHLSHNLVHKFSNINFQMCWPKDCP